MATRNLTLAPPEELVRGAEVVAAARETSISALVAEYLESLTADPDYDLVWRHERELMAAGLPMQVGPVSGSREDVHARAPD